MKKLEMEYGPFICTIIFCLIKIKERASYVKFMLRTSYIFARDIFSYRSLQNVFYNRY